MALIKCPECEKEISDKVKACPHCGFPLVEESTTDDIKTENIYAEKYTKSKIYSKKMALISVVGVLVLVSFAILIFFNGGSKKIEHTVTSYFDYLIAGDYENANKYLNVAHDYFDNSTFNKENTTTYLSKYSYEFKGAEIEGDSAIATVELKHPDMTVISKKYLQYLGANMFNTDKSDDQAFLKEQLRSENIEYISNSITLELKKENGDWKIITDNNFLMILSTGKSAELTVEQLSENEKLQLKAKQYINDFVKLENYKVGHSNKYDNTEVPSISKIEIKNNGDKDITELSLKINFIDASGTVILSRTVPIISAIDDAIKSGYSWKLEDDKFYELANLDDNINPEKANVEIIYVALKESIQEVKSEEQKYIEANMDILSSKVKECEGYDGTHPGLSDLSIKNRGDKNLSDVEVTVFFQDAGGKNIAENNLLVIGGLFSDVASLKANYSWKMESDKFYKLENLAKEVDLTRYTVKITDVTFEE